MGDERWLEADQQQTWFTLVLLLTRLPAALGAQLQRGAGLTHFEYQVLACLSAAPGHTLRMSALATMADGSLSRLSQVVSRLEKRGWVERHPDPEDGRTTLTALTDSGLGKLVATAPGHVAEVRRLVFDSLTKAQQRQLDRIGRRILHAIDPDRP
ncbi:MarR family winged helix-turn-helix transcriptional regulator [Actinoplanes regularis]|uniref:DNA-binding transcriptional regulator, MarR family n=1 Tax=Actinoplanes regularis TaxID=52697 RepID=A0A238YNL3_9ACTN|nr:MarR family transcriptional regulator [Actinoplanes regularis]GIE85396.1 MarR family transcriptional regulator [Actinoplanes regularis]SNR72173.1 DNA-binding transcriptional regulator, MarR family [Actinoplanes regularis]